jgi:hypothetical protein
MVTFENLVTIGCFTALIFGAGRAALVAAARRRAGHRREPVE